MVWLPKTERGRSVGSFFEDLREARRGFGDSGLPVCNHYDSQYALQICMDSIKRLFETGCLQ